MSERFVNVDDYEAAARERLEPGAYGYVAGGAGDEHTLRGNAAAYERWELRPRVLVSGEGAEVELDAEASERAVGALARCALRHGGLEEVELAVRGPELAISPVTPASAPVLLGEDLRDLGAAVAVRVVQARGGSVAVEGETLTIRLT